MFARLSFMLLCLLLPLALHAQDTPGTLQRFSFRTLEGKPFTNANLKPNTPLAVFYFDPYCDHCQAQAKLILEDAAAFKGTQLLWVSISEPDEIKGFVQKYWSPKVPATVHFLQDPDFRFDEYFGYSEVPSIYLYNADGVLQKAFKHETPASTLAGYLR